ncbi:MAG: hypothetical protein ACOX6W_14865 [Lentisphaeria bacterium]
MTSRPSSAGPGPNSTCAADAPPAVTDPHVAGHRGVDVGTVAAIRPGQPAWLRFHLKNHSLEKHDGLQVEIPGRERPYGFPVDDIRVFSQANASTGAQAFTAEPGATIEVPLPEDCPDLPINAKICQTSSQAVKQRYEWPAPQAVPVPGPLPGLFRPDHRSRNA